MTSVRPRARGDLAVVEIDGEVVIYDEISENLHHLNPTATMVFSLCDGQSTSAQLVDEIATAFDVEVSELKPQIAALLGQLHDAGLLEEGL